MIPEYSHGQFQMIRLTRRFGATLVGAVLFSLLPAHAEERETAAPKADCSAFEKVESTGREQVTRRIAEIDAAAERGDTARFCEASTDLVFVYRSLGAAALSCSAERARKWNDAEAQTQRALGSVCTAQPPRSG